MLGLHVVGVLEQAPADQDLRVGLDGVHDHRPADLVDVVEADVEDLVAVDEPVDLRLVGEEVLRPGEHAQGPTHLPHRPHPGEPLDLDRVGRQGPQLVDPVVHLEGSGGQVALARVLDLELAGLQGGVDVHVGPERLQDLLRTLGIDQADGLLAVPHAGLQVGEEHRLQLLPTVIEATDVGSDRRVDSVDPQRHGLRHSPPSFAVYWPWSIVGHS